MKRGLETRLMTWRALSNRPLMTDSFVDVSPFTAKFVYHTTHPEKDAGSWAGLKLVHFPPQPEFFLSLTPCESTQRIPQKCPR
jgi:hypothetical protein